MSRMQSQEGFDDPEDLCTILPSTVSKCSCSPQSLTTSINSNSHTEIVYEETLGSDLSVKEPSCFIYNIPPYSDHHDHQEPTSHEEL